MRAVQCMSALTSISFVRITNSSRGKQVCDTRRSVDECKYNDYGCHVVFYASMFDVAVANGKRVAARSVYSCKRSSWRGELRGSLCTLDDSINALACLRLLCYYSLVNYLTHVNDFVIRFCAVAEDGRRIPTAHLTQRLNHDRGVVALARVDRPRATRPK